MRQVWIFNHYAQKPSGAGGTRHFHLAENLLKYGWQTSIVAASVELNTGKQRLLEHEATKLEVINKIPFLWVRTPKYKGNNSGRILNMLTYAYRCLFLKTTKALIKPDVIIGSSVHPFAALSGALLAKRYRVPFIFEVRDLWPQTLIDMGCLKEKAYLTWFLRKLELWLYKQASKIIVLLPRAADYIVPLGIPKERIVWIPNGVDLSLFPTNTYSIDQRKSFTLMYFGAHGQANALENILYAMKKLQDEIKKEDYIFRLRLIGDGPLKPYLLELAKKLELYNVSFEPPVAKEEIPALAYEADAFIFNLKDSPVFKFGISSNKLFDFMASSRPTIFCCRSGNNPIAEAGAGLTVPPNDPEALAQAIIDISQMSLDELRLMAVGGRNYIEKNHSFQLLAKKLSDTLDQTLNLHSS